MTIPQFYHEWILWISARTGLTDPVLHIHAGLAVLLLVRLVSRRSFGSFIPLWFVVAAEAMNELMDYLQQSPLLADTLADIANTLFWPFVISLGSRLRPMVDPERPPSDEVPSPSDSPQTTPGG